MVCDSAALADDLNRKPTKRGHRLDVIVKVEVLIVATLVATCPTVREIDEENVELGATRVQEPRWTAENRPFSDTAKPAIAGVAIETREFYFDICSVRKSVWILVRQLRGPHLRTWA